MIFGGKGDPRGRSFFFFVGSMSKMGDYYVARLWQLKPGCASSELESLLASGLLEIHRWIPGIKRVSLVRLAEEHADRYLLLMCFTSFEACTYWRQVEMEGPDYWERFASVLMHWEQLSVLVDEYMGEMVVDVRLDDGAPRPAG